MRRMANVKTEKKEQEWEKEELEKFRRSTERCRARDGGGRGRKIGHRVDKEKKEKV